MATDTISALRALINRPINPKKPQERQKDWDQLVRRSLRDDTLTPNIQLIVDALLNTNSEVTWNYFVRALKNNHLFENDTIVQSIIRAIMKLMIESPVQGTQYSAQQLAWRALTQAFDADGQSARLISIAVKGITETEEAKEAKEAALKNFIRVLDREKFSHLPAAVMSFVDINDRKQAWGDIVHAFKDSASEEAKNPPAGSNVDTETAKKFADYIQTTVRAIMDRPAETLTDTWKSFISSFADTIPLDDLSTIIAAIRQIPVKEDDPQRQQKTWEEFIQALVRLHILERNIPNIVANISGIENQADRLQVLNRFIVALGPGQLFRYFSNILRAIGENATARQEFLQVVAQNIGGNRTVLDALLGENAFNGRLVNIVNAINAGGNQQQAWNGFIRAFGGNLPEADLRNIVDAIRNIEDAGARQQAWNGFVAALGPAQLVAHLPAIIAAIGDNAAARQEFLQAVAQNIRAIRSVLDALLGENAFNGRLAGIVDAINAGGNQPQAWAGFILAFGGNLPEADLRNIVDAIRNIEDAGARQQAWDGFIHAFNGDLVNIVNFVRNIEDAGARQQAWNGFITALDKNGRLLDGATVAAIVRNIVNIDNISSRKAAWNNFAKASIAALAPQSLYPEIAIMVMFRLLDSAGVLIDGNIVAKLLEIDSQKRTDDDTFERLLTQTELFDQAPPAPAEPAAQPGQAASPSGAPQQPKTKKISLPLVRDMLRKQPFAQASQERQFPPRSFAALVANRAEISSLDDLVNIIRCDIPGRYTRSLLEDYSLMKRLVDKELPTKVNTAFLQILQAMLQNLEFVSRRALEASDSRRAAKSTMDDAKSTMDKKLDAREGAIAKAKSELEKTSDSAVPKTIETQLILALAKDGSAYEEARSAYEKARSVYEKAGATILDSADAIESLTAALGRFAETGPHARGMNFMKRFLANGPKISLRQHLPFIAAVLPPKGGRRQRTMASLAASEFTPRIIMNRASGSLVAINHALLSAPQEGQPQQPARSRSPTPPPSPKESKRLTPPDETRRAVRQRKTTGKLRDKIMYGDGGEVAKEPLTGYRSGVGTPLLGEQYDPGKAATPKA